MLFQQSAITTFRRIDGVDVNVSIGGSDQQTHYFLNPMHVHTQSSLFTITITNNKLFIHFFLGFLFGIIIQKLPV